LSCSVAARSAGGIVAVAPTAGSSDDVVADGLYDGGALVVDPSAAGWLDWSTCGWPYWLGWPYSDPGPGCEPSPYCDPAP
jgi:hypothetical protein